MRDKTGIITFHFVCNCGAVLQCQAIFETLKKLGCNAEVIDYRPTYHAKQYSKYADLRREFKAIRIKYGTKTMKDRLHAWYSVVVWLKKNSPNQVKFRQERLKKFQTYLSEHVILSKRCTTHKQLREIAGRYKCIIAGSDQIWNKEITGNSFDGAYFLSFADKETVCLSYAASCGVFPENDEMFPALLSRFDAISVREKKDAGNLASKYKINAETVTDPVFLVGKDEWLKSITDCHVDKEYILVYCLEPTNEFINIVNTMSRKYSIGVVNISPNRVCVDNEIVVKQLCEPGEFLGLIADAKYVVTNSFHATAFSIIFHKQFISVTHSRTGGRINDLLELLGMQNCLYNGSVMRDFPLIDYQSVDAKVSQLRNKSMEFLFRHLNGEKDGSKSTGI